MVTADYAAPAADLIVPLESLAEACASGARVVIRPQWKYNFKYMHFAELLYTAGRHALDWTQEKFREVARRHDFKARRGIPHIAVLSYAGIERRNALALVMLAHEIGHLLDRHYNLSVRPEVLKERGKAAAKLRKAVARILIKGTREQKERAAQTVDELESEAGYWIGELVADVAALRLVGPAYISALKATAYSLCTYKKLPPQHPPLEDRMKWVLSESKALGHIEFFDKRAPDNPTAAIIREYLLTQATEVVEAGTVATGPSVGQDEEGRTRLLRDLMRPATQKALARLREEVLPDQKCFLLSDDIFRMVNLLTREVPPCQSYVRNLDPEADKKRDPKEQCCFSLAAILNAGWMFYLTHVMKDRKPVYKDAEGKKVDPETVELQRVSDLVTLAVKQSSFLEDFTRRAAQERDD